MACEAHLKGPLSMVSLHAAIAHGKPTLREQGVQPKGLLPVPLSLQTKNGCQHMMLQIKDESGVPCLDPTNSSMHDAVGWTQRGEGRAGGGWGGVGGWCSKTTSDRDQLGKNLPQMTGSAHQQHLALLLTQCLLDAKHDTCFIPKRLVYTCHDK